LLVTQALACRDAANVTMGMRDAQRSQAKPDKMPRDNEMHDVNHGMVVIVIEK
jgi:soluble cytochrome b562